MLNRIRVKFKGLLKHSSLGKRNALSLPNVKIAQTARAEMQNIVLRNNNFVSIGDGTILEGRIVFDRDDARVEIGANSFIGGSNIIAAESITIGNDVLIAWGCVIVDHNSHSIYFSERANDVKDWYVGKKDWSKVLRKSIIIMDKAWIGFNSIILKGVTIGEGAVVAAGSVVTRDVAPYTIVAGNPAQAIRVISENERLE